MLKCFAGSRISRVHRSMVQTELSDPDSFKLPSPVSVSVGFHENIKGLTRVVSALSVLVLRSIEVNNENSLTDLWPRCGGIDRRPLVVWDNVISPGRSILGSITGLNITEGHTVKNVKLVESLLIKSIWKYIRSGIFEQQNFFFLIICFERHFMILWTVQ